MNEGFSVNCLRCGADVFQSHPTCPLCGSDFSTFFEGYSYATEEIKNAISLESAYSSLRDIAKKQKDAQYGDGILSVLPVER
jgi:transposase-like protein